MAVKTPAPSRPQRARRDVADERVRAWRLAMEATTALIARFDGDFRSELGIDVKTYDVLLHVFDAGRDGIRMTDLARAVVLTKAGLTSLVDRLEQRSLARRTPDPADRRAVRVRLTAEGERLFRAAGRLHVGGIHERFSAHVSEEEARVLAEVFGRLLSANR